MHIETVKSTKNVSTAPLLPQRRWLVLPTWRWRRRRLRRGLGREDRYVPHALAVGAVHLPRTVALFAGGAGVSASVTAWAFILALLTPFAVDAAADAVRAVDGPVPLARRAAVPDGLVDVSSTDPHPFVPPVASRASACLAGEATHALALGADEEPASAADLAGLLALEAFCAGDAQVPRSVADTALVLAGPAALGAQGHPRAVPHHMTEPSVGLLMPWIDPHGLVEAVMCLGRKLLVQAPHPQLIQRLGIVRGQAVELLLVELSGRGLLLDPGDLVLGDGGLDTAHPDDEAIPLFRHLPLELTSVLQVDHIGRRGANEQTDSQESEERGRAGFHNASTGRHPDPLSIIPNNSLPDKPERVDSSDLTPVARTETKT